MRLDQISATAHPAGNRIDLSWAFPAGAPPCAVRVVRRADRYPEHPGDGVVVPAGLLGWLDPGLLADLEAEMLSPALRQACLERGAPLAANAALLTVARGRLWHLGATQGRCTLRVVGGRPAIYDERLPYAYDEGLRSETTYYYTLFPIEDHVPLRYDLASAPYNRAAALATGAYNMAGQLYDLLPALYRRYDLAGGQGQPLQRFLSLPGGQLDQLYSRARALLNLSDLDRVDGRLLGLLADWIGWRTDFRNDIQTQRNELHFAPRVQEITGTIPMIEATIKRLIDWECRAKEFAGNVFRSNQPPRLNLWAAERVRGAWGAAAPLSLDFAYEGRPAAAARTTPDGTTHHWLFYHTPHANGAQAGAAHIPPPAGSRLCAKSALTFRLSRAAFGRHFRHGTVSPALLAAFARHGLALSLDLAIVAQKAEPGQPRAWLLCDRSGGARYSVREAGDHDLLVQCEWSPGQPVREPPPGQLDRHPSAAWLGDTLWLFWDVYDEQTQGWHVACRTYQRGRWAEAQRPQRNLPCAGQCRAPCAVLHAGKLRLLWLERGAGGWRLRLSTLEGRRWSQPADFPPLIVRRAEGVQEIDPHVEDDLLALSDAQGRLWLFWAWREPVEGLPGQARWRIAYRAAQDDGLQDWGPIFALPAPPDADDREPAAIIGQPRSIELFWSSTRDGSWSIWRGELNAEGRLRGRAEALSAGPYTQRAPLPLAYGGGTLLVYRSNESLSYASAEYGATRTLDTRYAGCTSVEPRNAARVALRRQYTDFETYSYELGPGGRPDMRSWYRRDTVGLYLRPGDEDGAEIARNQRQIAYLLRQFLPIQVRVVFIIEPWPVDEPVYDYGARDGRRIGEELALELTAAAAEQYAGLAEGGERDRIRGWTWLRAWPHTVSPQAGPGAENDVTSNPLYRTWRQDVELEE